MEFNITTVTLSALLASFSGNSVNRSTAQVSTETLPAIAGQWKIDLRENVNNPYSSTINKDIKSLYSTHSHSAYDDEGNPKLLKIKKTLHTHPPSISNKLDIDENNSNMDLVNQSTQNASTTVISKNNDAQLGISTADSDKNCRELYNFGRNNRLRVSSGKEITWGRYFISYQPSGLPLIIMTTDYDNNAVDCSGNQIDQTGDSMIAFLNYQESKMSWCIDAKGDKCTVHFHRVYP